MFSTTVLNIHFMENVNTVASTKLGKSLSSGDRTRMCLPIVYLSRAKGGKKKSSRLSATCVSHYGREAFFWSTGGLWRNQISRTCLSIPVPMMVAIPSYSSPIIIGFEWPFPLIPDRTTFDRNAIYVYAFISYQVIPVRIKNVEICHEEI